MANFGRLANSVTRTGFVGILTLLANLPTPAAAERDRGTEVTSASWTARAWEEDLEFLAEQVWKRHARPSYYGPSREEYFAHVASLRDDIPNLTPGRTVLELSRLHARLEDGHSEMLWPSVPSDVLDQTPVPIEFRHGPRGPIVVGASPSYDEFLGWSVAEVNGHPVESVVESLAEYVSGDNSFFRTTFATSYLLTLPGVLYELGIVDDPAVIHFRFEDPATGRTSRVTVTAEGGTESDRRFLADDAPDPPPAHVRHRDEIYAYEFFEEPGLVYMAYNRVASDDQDPFDDFCRRLFEFCETRDVDKLVIDMRHNRGGDPELAWPLIHRAAVSDRLNRHGHLFVIIGRETKSAGPSVAVRLQNLTEAIFVGEPTGGRPNGFGNAAPIVLPNAGITFLCSGFFAQPTFRTDPRPWIEPDIAAEATAEDLASHRDPALEAILDFRAVGSFAKFVGDDLDALSDDTMLADAHSRFRAIERNKWINIEDELIDLGYLLLETERPAAAENVFRLAIRIYPRSWNAWDSWAESLAALGRVEEAVRAYERSHEMSRSNVNALRQIERLRAGGR